MQAKIIAKKVLMMPTNQFDRYAYSYSQNREIQDKIAKRLLSCIDAGKYKKIIDIGCGDGSLFEKCGQTSELFVGVDASLKMCDLHKRFNGCIVIRADFDDDGFTDFIKGRFGKFELLLSSSALQWSKNIKVILYRLSELSDEFAISVFTRGTFASVREFLGVDSFLPTIDDAEEALVGFDLKSFFVDKFQKEFESPKDAVRYIKTTGVSGGSNKISYKEAKALYENGPKVLEFEVIYAVGSFAKRDFSIS